MESRTFLHHQHAHCESGVTANLLQHYGLPVSEPMAFGIGAGIFFAHIPFLKINGTPGTTFRTWPGAIFKRATERLHIKIATQKFRQSHKAMQSLDEVLATGTPVGMQAGVFYLPYLPEVFRFHFNAHNLVVYGKQADGQYLVSDPILEEPALITAEDLRRARFAKGAPEPKGFMYYIKEAPSEIDFSTGIYKGLKQACFFNLSPPLPWFGNNAFNTLAKELTRYPKKLTDRKASLYLGNIIRMQEEIGTGGGGFRFLYAAFLQEAGHVLGRKDFLSFSTEMTAIGDDWRHFAYSAARQMKNRKADVISYDELAQLLRNIGKREKIFFKELQLAITKK